jgi:thymidylate kinase
VDNEEDEIKLINKDKNNYDHGNGRSSSIIQRVKKFFPSLGKEKGDTRETSTNKKRGREGRESALDSSSCHRPLKHPFHFWDERAQQFVDKYIITERSIQSSQHIFMKMLHGDGVVDDVEQECYHKWLETLKATHICPELSAILYVDTPPDLCYSRIMSRARGCEVCSVSLEYLVQLSEMHREWIQFLNNLRGPHGEKLVRVIRIDGSQSTNDVLRQSLNALMLLSGS